MSDILEVIKRRRSIRKYTAEPVSKEQIQALLEAAMAAPSASNRRPWEFVVITDEKRLEALRARLPFGRYNAPLAIIVCADMRRAYPGPGRDFWIADCSAAMENILLAATGMGLGSVWVGVYPIGLLIRAVASLLNLPEQVVPLGVAYIGHPAETKPPRTQYDASRVHWQEFAPHPPKPRRKLWPFGKKQPKGEPSQEGDAI